MFAIKLGFLFIFIRLVGYFLTAPFFSNTLINDKSKIVVIFTLSMAVSLVSEYTLIQYSAGYLLLTFFLEFFNGIVLGLISKGIIDVVNIAGEMIDHQVGFGMAKVAGIGDEVMGLTSRLFEFVALVIFVLADGHLYFLSIVIEQKSIMEFFNIQVFAGYYALILNYMSFVVTNGVALAIPFVLVFLTIDVGLGIVNKTFQKFNVFLFSLPLKVGVYIFLLSYYVYVLANKVHQVYDVNLNFLEKLVM